MNVIDKLTDSDIERFWSKVDVRNENECWAWRGCVTPKGAGIFTAIIEGKHCNITAHHVSYFIKYNEDLFGKPMEKFCETVGCCNPNHYHLKNKDINKQIIFNKRLLKRFWSKVDIKGEDDCWEWKRCVGNKGYGHFNLSYKTIRSHRLSYMIANNLQYIDPNIAVCHRCDNPSCVNPKHLFIGTFWDNNQDRHSKGRDGSAKGENHGNAKLKTNQVLEIIKLYAQSAISRKDLADTYNVSESCIDKIVDNKSWKHIDRNSI